MVKEISLRNAALCCAMLVPCMLFAQEVNAPPPDEEVRPFEDEFHAMHPGLNRRAVEEASRSVIILVSILFFCGVALVIGWALYLRSEQSDSKKTELKRGKNFVPWKVERDAPSTRYEIDE